MKEIKTSLFLFVSVLLLSACDKSTQSDNAYQSLRQLETQLLDQGDELFAYAMKSEYIRDKSFALYAHIEEDGQKTLYYYDLEKKETSKLFTTNNDSVHVLNMNYNTVIHGISDLDMTPDSCALMIKELYTYLYPLSKQRTVISLGMGEPELYYDDSTIGELIVSKPIYETMSFGDLPIGESGENGNYTPFEYARKVTYNTNGEVVSMSDEVTFIDNGYNSIDRRKLDGYVMPAIVVNDVAEASKYVTIGQAYNIDELRQLSNNRINFKETFQNTLCYFDLVANTIKENNATANDKKYRIEGDNFFIVTDNQSFVDLKYPCRMIIRAECTNIQDYRAEMSFVNNISVLFGGSGLNIGENVDFIFSDATLYYSSIAGD